MVVGAADEEEEGVPVVVEVVGAEEDDEAVGVPAPAVLPDVGWVFGAAASPVPNWFAASELSC